jgi:membrane protease YdiL (CAAX protease family)/Flp pilus assembly protein TadD
LGRTLYELGKYQDALASFSKVLELAPINSDAHYRLGCCHYRLGDLRHAVASFQHFVAANPTNGDGHYWLSRSLSASGNHAEAEASIRKAIALGTAPARYYDQWGCCLAQQSRYKEAIAAHKQALALDADDTFALLRLGACYYQSHAYREAVIPMGKYTAAKPNDFYGFYYLGHSHFELFQFDQAARALQRAHELNPDDGLTRVGLFGSYMATARYEEAFKLYPFVYKAGGGILVFGYAIGLAWMLVWSFKARISLVPPILATFPGYAPPHPPQLGDCQTLPPLLPGSIAPVVVSKAARATALPGMLFCLGWLALFIGGQFACAFLLGSFAPFRGVAAMLAGMGAASLPLVVAAGAVFPRQPWGAPFAWPKPFPPARLLVLALLGLISFPLFESGYSKLVEWITHKPFPVQVALPLIQEALHSNPVSVVVSVVFFAPMAEEVLFRGLLFGALQKWLSTRSTILVTAALFALIHMQAIYFLPIFLLGLLCGWARHKSGSLAVPMSLHVLNNGISLLLMQLFPEAT